MLIFTCCSSALYQHTTYICDSINLHRSANIILSVQKITVDRKLQCSDSKISVKEYRGLSLWSLMLHVYSVSQKISPWGFLTFFAKRLGIFNNFFTHLLYVPIYARLQIFIQLSATLTKLCHIKRDHPVHIICSMSAIGRSARVQMFAKVIDSFVDRCLWQVITDLLQCTF